ncbi:MAG: type II and III secretion system family protein [Alphaproteobacteria bacterium]|nr:type II and III secretion system family protein [Alphaproteobacteria bacterium]
MSSYVSVSAHFRCVVCTLFLLILSAFLLSSCDLAANYTKTDRASNMEFQDFRDGLTERLPEVDDEKTSLAADASIPALQPYISMTPDNMQSMPLVSVSVNQSVPLRDVLYELAQQAEYDLELDPNIRGAIIFTARNKPLDVVIDRMCDVAGLRYKFEEGFLRVEVDTPYIKTYKVDYLSFVRSNSGTVSTNVSVVSGEGADTGSAYSASSDSTSDFWSELELNLTQILGGASTGALKTRSDPRISAVEQNPEVAAVSPRGQPREGEDGSLTVQPPEAVLRVESLPVDMEGEAGGAAADGAENAMTFSLNKQAGMINIYASERVHKQVEKYLMELRRSVTSQVLVEAKIFEVSLFDEYINGIDWRLIGAGDINIGEFTSAGGSYMSSLDHYGSMASLVPLAPNGTVAVNTNFVAGIIGNDFQGLIRAISGFGTVRALASPRLTVLNNQSAILNVATNRVFFKLDVTQEVDEDTGDTNTEVDSEIKSVPEGVLINVQPSINLDERTISMLVRPTITRIVGVVQDPAIQFVAGASGIVSEIPEVNVQEIDTVIKVRSGQPIVMGGLLQDRIVNNQESVPILGEVPILGNIFKDNSGSISKTELVIFLKATLLESMDQSIHDTDKDLYKTFSGDRRPFKL